MNQREDFIAKSTEYIKLYGLNDNLLEKVSLEEFNDINYASKLFADVKEFLIYYLTEENKLFRNELNKCNIKDKRISDLIFEAVKLKLNMVDKEILTQIIKYIFTNPLTPEVAIDSLYRVSNVIWDWLGDNDLDFSYYTKRISLSLVVSTIMLYYVNTDDFSKVEALLSKQIYAISGFAKMKNAVKTKIFG